MNKPKIRHIALITRDTERLAQFYKDVFQMEELFRSKPQGDIPAIYLTDGYLNLAVLPCRLTGDIPTGLHHFGWQIESMSEISEVLVSHGTEEPKLRPSNRPYAEFRGCDLDGNFFDLSEHGYQKSEFRTDREEVKDVKSKVPAE